MLQRFYIFFLGCLLFASCIDEYTDLPEGAGEPRLVVEGHLVSGQRCFLTLSQTATLSEASSDGSTQNLKSVDAYVLLEGGGVSVTGTKYHGISGYYCIDVPIFIPGVSYKLTIRTNNLGDYETEPTEASFAPYIDSLCADMPNDDGQVHINVSTGDPEGLCYLLWEYDEYYEVLTPLHCLWSYDPMNDEFYYRNYRIDQGWITEKNHPSIIASNEAYGLGALRDFTLYQEDNEDLRFRTKYMTVVRQYGISEEEYEYRRQLKTQSTDVGGIFATMPSELPSNLKTSDGKRAVGYVGFRGNVVESTLVVDPKEVNFHDWAIAEFADDEDLEGKDYYSLDYYGWAPYEYIPALGPKWAKKWCLDCRENYWNGGASLTKPDVWPF